MPDVGYEWMAPINISLIESIAIAYRSKNLATLAVVLRKKQL